MAEASHLSPESSLEAAPRPPSFLKSALGLLRGTSRTPRDAGPTIRQMFAPTRSSRRTSDEPPDSARGMRRALKTELNRVSGSRYVLRHLAMIEHDLKTDGHDLFERLPLRVLERASAQLESLVESPVTPGVAALRSRLSVSILARERIERPARRPASAAAEIPAAARASSGGAAGVSRPPVSEPAHLDEAAHAVPATPPARTATVPRGAVSSATLAAVSAWGGADHLEVRESSFADFEQASTEWSLLDEPRQP